MARSKGSYLGAKAWYSFYLLLCPKSVLKIGQAFFFHVRNRIGVVVLDWFTIVFSEQCECLGKVHSCISRNRDHMNDYDISTVYNYTCWKLSCSAL